MPAKRIVEEKKSVVEKAAKPPQISDIVKPGDIRETMEFADLALMLRKQ